MADDLNKPSFYPRVGNIRPQPRSPLQQAEMRERPLDVAMGALKRVLDRGSELLDKNPATPFDVTRGLVNAIPFIGPNTAKQFENSNVSIPVGMSLDSRNAGIETVDIPTKDALNAIKWSDLVGTAGASRAAESLGYGEAPEFFDALDASMVGLGGLQAAKIAARVPRAAKFAVTQAAKDFAQASAAAAPRVVKPKGGNWLTGSVEKTVKPLKRNEKAAENLEEMRRVYPPEALATMSEETRASVDRAFPQLEQEAALNKWVDSNLAGYMKKEMGTPEDPIRALFERRTQEIDAKYAKDMEKSARLEQRAQSEQDPRRAANLMRESQQVASDAAAERDLTMKHIAHFPSNEVEFANAWIPEDVAVQRVRGGFPTHGLGESPTAKAWETMSDQAIYGNTAEKYREPLTSSEIRQGYGSLVDTNPWLTKLDPDTMVYHPEGTPADLGFDHVIDVLRQDVASGRIRPEQLNKVSMEQAVQRAAEYDLEMAIKMRDAVIKQQEGFPIYKDYGDEGYRWVELAPKEVKSKEDLGDLGLQAYFDYMKSGGDEAYALKAGQRADAEKYLADALKYEGDTMGHCVGGYCPDVLEGRSRIYSLRDKRGEPHVTVEVQPGIHSHFDFNKWWESQPKELRDEINARARRGEHGGSVFEAPEYLAARAELPSSIKQIKGKQNAKPKEDYIPYVQDFVRSGEWNDVGDLRNTGLRDINSDLSLKKYLEGRDIKFDRYVPEETYQGYADDFLMDRLYPKDDVRYAPPEEGMAAGGTPRYPTEQEREAMRKLRESFVPAVKDAERLKRLRDNMEKSEQKKVSFSDNPDAMMMELSESKMAKAANDDEVHMAGGGVSKLAKVAKAKKVEELTKLERAPAKTKAEIEAIAQRIAPQMTGEYVRESAKSAKTVAGKTKKQFEREKTLEHDIRPTGDERPLPETVDIESLKGNIMMGIAGDPTITGKTVYGVAGEPLKSPAPQHGGPYYGLGQDDKFWASQLGAAQGVQNRAGALSQLYEAPVIGNYVKMGPDSYSYAQHFADTNLQNIHPERMTKAQIEGFNELVRKGSAKSGPRPSFAGIENPDLAYLQFAVDPELRKHFGNLMQMPTITEKFGLRSGQDVAHAVTEPDLRNLEIGVTGKSLGLMRPDVTELKLSEHPTYSHDIPGQFIGGLKYPTPYELMFPDSIKAVRENPAQAPQEFGSFKMSGPRQIIDPQMIDEIKQYEEFIKKYTGKAEGGEITVKPKKMAEGGEITAEDLEIEERPL